MPNEEKDMKKLNEQLKNMPKPSLTKRQHQNIHQNILQSKMPSNFKRYGAMLGAAVALFVFSFLIFTAINNKEHTASNLTTNALLDHIVVEDNLEYRFENFSWFITQKEVQENIVLPSGTESQVKADGDNRSSKYKIPKEITFTDIEIAADVIVEYNFFNDLFVGGKYIIHLDTEKDLIEVATKFKNHLKKQFPEPNSNTLDSLSEESIKNNSQIGPEWWKGENNIDFSSFGIEILNQSDTHAILISVSSADSELEDILQDDLGTHPLEADQALVSALQKELNTEEKVNIEKVDQISDDVFGILTIESDIPEEGVFYTTEENDEWEIHEIDVAQIDLDTPFTHHELLGELEKDAKCFRITAGYLNDSSIQDILITHQNNDMSKLTIRSNQQVYLHIDMEHEEVSKEAFNIKSIEGLDEEENVLFEYTW